MLEILKELIARTKPAPLPATPAEERIYAIGDVHGHLDLLNALLEQIEANDAARGDARTTLILLGDLVDRGPDSAGVVRRVRELTEGIGCPVDWRIHALQGNHEEMFLASFDDPEALRSLLGFGARETLASYGIFVEASENADMAHVQRRMKAEIPEDDRAFLADLKDMVQVGDYIFVHAGLRPQTPLSMQLGRDMRWIREPFLSHDGDFGGVVIHGHTIRQEPECRHNRIGIDTGAYVHGTLTAIGLEGTEQWFLQAHTVEARDTVQAEL